MKQLHLVLLALLTATSGVATAASDSNGGSTSSGTSRVSLTKLNIVQITGVEDMVFANVDVLKPDVEVSMDICVRNTAAQYSVTVTSSNHAFNVAHEDNKIPYTVSWDGVGVDFGSAVTGLTATSELECPSGNNATLSVNFEPEAFNAAPAGTYSDVLTIEVAPE